MRCDKCTLVFVPPSDYCTRAHELSRYALHNNSLSNKNYVSYIAQLIPLLLCGSHRKPAVLDFGSGPARVLEYLLRRENVRCTSYDPLYDVNATALSQAYDIVVMNEVIEHLRKVGDECARIGECIHPGGRLVVRTRILDNQPDFGSWWYKNDITHINFFSISSFSTVESIVGCRVELS